LVDSNICDVYEGNLTREQAQALMPPIGGIYKDTVNARWHAFMTTGTIKKHIASRNYIVHGERNACLNVLYQSYIIWELQSGRSSPFTAILRGELERAGVL
jgi:hypothetical protein